MVGKRRAVDSDETMQTITCPICREEGLQMAACSQVAACGHRFCSVCIERWAESCSMCPLCKQEMGALASLAAKPRTRRGPNPAAEGGAASSSTASSSTAVGPGRRRKRLRPVVVPQRRLELPVDEEIGETAEIVCEACGSGHDEQLLLLCDSCNDAYHTFCLQPPLEEAPLEDWHCPRCCEASCCSSPLGRPPGRHSFLGPSAASISKAPDSSRCSQAECDLRLPASSRRRRLLCRTSSS
eukprot:TRINITY_DN111718_c0_g1_i1.p1 TRINITY_DN111718_c0_g1~~TRINITY_DN111718_c0_g1_i1.p1  ORF type:complete len:254 (+),score=52.81 TRINITY_DN111718_c0_g1_i1:40-762(+)